MPLAKAATFGQRAIYSDTDRNASGPKSLPDNGCGTNYVARQSQPKESHMLATLPAATFQRLGISGRLRLRATRRRQVRLAEMAHRHRFPDRWDHVGRYNVQPDGQGGWEL